jgi:hypothetical protein
VLQFLRELLFQARRGLGVVLSEWCVAALRVLLLHHKRAPAKIVRLIRILAAREHAISQLSSTAAFAPRIGLT